MKTALIIIDIQNDYFENGSNPLVGSKQASIKARMILDKFRNTNLPIIHIQHLSIRPNSTFFIPDTFGAEININVKPQENEKVITKYFPNAFIKTDLLDYLKDNAIENLVICGMMTHMCVDSTVRAAKDFGFNIVLIEDACATKDLEVNGQFVKAIDVQNSFLGALNYYFATLKTSEAYLNESKS